MQDPKAVLPIRFFNTLHRKIEDFVPLVPGKVSLYCCGPTVYNLAHIGNLRTYVFEDVLRRVLTFAGYDVRHVMNFTDVGHLQSDADFGDDKMSLATAREKKSPWEIAAYYGEAFLKHCAMLNILKPTVICKATDHIPEMIQMVQTLVEKGFAYESEGNVYFEVSKFPNYTAFSGLTLDQQTMTERVQHDNRKRSQADFALWLSSSKFPNQIMKWDSPWGVGFPGWHIECSAMATKHLGEHFDIHCGGIDHISLHHPNEIAQSECSLGHKWVNYWLHGAFLNDETGKMSKSKGDFLSLDLLIKNGFDPLDYRYLLLTTHYRSELNFTDAALESARSARLSLKERVRKWREDGGDPELSDEALTYRKQFVEAILDDLHMPIALTAMWAAAKSEKISSAEKLAIFEIFDEVTGLGLMALEERTASEGQLRMIAEREKARSDKNWAEADRLRDALLAEGIQVEDTREGMKWRFKD